MVIVSGVMVCSMYWAKWLLLVLLLGRRQEWLQQLMPLAVAAVVAVAE